MCNITKEETHEQSNYIRITYSIIHTIYKHNLWTKGRSYTSCYIYKKRYQHKHYKQVILDQNNSTPQIERKINKTV